MKHAPTVLLLIATVFWFLAALKVREPDARWTWGWGGMFFFGLSLIWPILQSL